MVSQYSTDGGKTFKEYRGTNLSDESNADPAMYDLLAPVGLRGSFIVPQHRDYFQAVAKRVTETPPSWETTSWSWASSRRIRS